MRSIRSILGFEKRGAVNDPNMWISRLFSGTSSAGVSVTSDTALKSAAVYACNKVLAETIASLPLMVYRRTANSKEPATDYFLYSILHDTPNTYQTSFEWREGLVSHLNLRGNSYHQIIRVAGKVRQLIPLNPMNMTVTAQDDQIRYEYRYEDGKTRVFDSSDIWHVKNLSIASSYNGTPEGLVGISPIQVARETIGTALAADEYAGRYFSNNASIGMKLKHPGKLSENAKSFLKNSLADYGKLENKFKSMILEEGMDAETIGMSNVDSQFLESRNFQVEDIARIFRVPSVLIGHPDKTMTYASAEQLFLFFVTHTIRPYCVRLEQSMHRYLIPERDRSSYFVEHVLAGLLRGDTASRFLAYSVARQWGWMNVDEIRALENMNPLPDGKGKIYIQPLNMAEAGAPPPIKPIPPGGELDA